MHSEWIDSGEAAELHEVSAVNLKNIDKLFISIAEEANDYQQNLQEQRETIDDLQDPYASIHDIQSQLLIPNKRYTEAAMRASHAGNRFSNIGRNTNMR